MAEVSVVIPTHNRFEPTVQAVSSVLSQSFGDVEVLVVDDCSSDGSLARLEIHFLGKNVKFLKTNLNSGAASCRNLGADAASGRFISFLDSDDVWLPNKIESQMQRYREISGRFFDPFIVYSPAILEYSTGGSFVNPTRSISVDELVEKYIFMSGQDIQTSGWFMTVESFNNVRFSPGLRRHQDLDFCIRAQAAGIKFFMTDLPLYRRGHSSSNVHVGKVRDDGVSDGWIRSMKSITDKIAYHHFCLETIFPVVVDSNPRLARSLVWEALRDGVLTPGKLKYHLLRTFGFYK